MRDDMRIYALTEKGRSLARSTSAPRSPSWKIIYFLDKHDKSDADTIAQWTGLQRGEAIATLSTLKANGVVVEG